MPEEIIDQTIVNILYKLTNDELPDAEEQQILNRWTAASARRQALVNDLMNDENVLQEVLVRYRFDLTEEWNKMAGRINPSNNNPAPILPHRIPLLKRNWLRIAALLLLTAGAGLCYFYNHTPEKPRTVASASSKGHDIAPRRNKALLTLGDGSIIILDSAAEGNISLQGNTAIVKTGSGSLAYNADADHTTAHAEPVFNTVSTPRGGQYQVVLPDGSKVWLNAASSIRFPAAFTGKERNVELKGEAYFEIAANRIPFTVSSAGMQVQVLGTNFNINTYDNEDLIKTTLVSGSIKISADAASAILLPGQQSIVETASRQKQRLIRINKNADTNQALAWKNGLFNFKDADLASVMRQLERWYDIDVQYEGAVPKAVFQGQLTRDLSLAQVLRILQTVEIQFRLQGRTLTVTS